MAEGKKSFVLYTDLLNVVGLLSDEQAGKLFRTILEYVNDKNPDPDDMVTKLAFEPIRLQLKRDLGRWTKFRDKQAEYGKMGGRPKVETAENQKEKKGSLFSERVESLNATVTVNANATVKGNTVRFAPPAKEDVVTEMMKKIDDFSAMAEAEKFFDYYTSNGWHVGKNKMKDWKSAVRNWIRNSTKFSNNASSKSFNGNSRSTGANQLVESLRADFKP